MNVGLYQSASSLTALERWQDVVTQNISSGQVNGFKRRVAQVHGAETSDFGAALNQGTKWDKVAGKAVFPQLDFVVDFTRGETMTTRGELDLALQSEGFFQVQTPDGDTRYMRTGQFRVTSDRQIESTAGDRLLDPDGYPVQLLPIGGEITIDTDGQIMQGGNPTGKIGIVEFADNNELIPLSGSLFLAPEGMEPEAMVDPYVVQGNIEASNVKPLREMVDLVSISRAYEANQKIIQSSDEMMQKTLETLG
jgi:flagellar basal body rod protein FlgG